MSVMGTKIVWMGQTSRDAVSTFLDYSSPLTYIVAGLIWCLLLTLYVHLHKCVIDMDSSYQYYIVNNIVSSELYCPFPN